MDVPDSVGTVPEVVVSARDLSVHYRTRNSASYTLAVAGVSFDLAEGEVLGVVGESGSGKSTLAFTVAARAGHGLLDDGIAEICGGTLSVYGTQVRGITARQLNRLTLRVGYLPQDGAIRLDPRLTVAENVAEPIYQRDRRFDQYDAADAVAALIDAVRLSLGMMNRMPHELSSGQRQRVALARALILEPTLLVADEPTRGVDATVREGVLDVIRELQAERRFSALIVSSDIGVVDRVADRVAVLERGIMIGLGTMDDVLAAPTHPYLKGLAAARRSSSSREIHHA
jgi:ABC-type glutathione transport system ATPase component